MAIIGWIAFVTAALLVVAAIIIRQLRNTGNAVAATDLEYIKSGLDDEPCVGLEASTEHDPPTGRSTSLLKPSSSMEGTHGCAPTAPASSAAPKPAGLSSNTDQSAGPLASQIGEPQLAALFDSINEHCGPAIASRIWLEVFGAHDATAPT